MAETRAMLHCLQDAGSGIGNTLEACNNCSFSVGRPKKAIVGLVRAI
jgi:hypothetical protein